MGKKLLSLFLVICIVGGILPTTVFASQAQSVSGFIAPIEDPDASAIRIFKAEELAAIKDNMYGSYVLMNDIDMSSYGDWIPIGTSLSNPFRGTFDGQGHTISGLRVHSEITSGTLVPPSHAVGLFGICNGAQIKNVALTNAQITVSNSSGYIYEATKIDGATVYAGSIVGHATNSTVIYNCHSSGSISATLSGEAQGSPFAGGIAGFLDMAIISYCYNECSVSAGYSSSLFGFDSYAGGLVGCFNTDGVIDHSYNSGKVTSTLGDYAAAYAGGLVGTSNTSSLRITDCFNDATITSSSGSGGLFGGGNSYAGGISATFSGSIQRSYNGGAVSANVNDSYGISNGNAYAGGICGEITTSATIEYCVAAHSTASARAGGQGSSYQYRIAYGNGTKESNITVNQVTSGSQNDANITRSAEELKVIGTYRDELSWDFDATWEMVSEKDFPQLKQVDVKSEGYIDEYITDHLGFINGNTYENILANYRWAQIYWSEENNFKSNAGEFLYRSIDGLIDIATLDFKELFDDDNPYKIILLDYISDQTVQDETIELYKVTVPYSLDKNLKKAEDFVKKNWKSDWGKLDDKDLFWLFRYSDKPSEGWITENFENHIDEIIFGLKDDTNSWAKVFNIADETWNSVVTAKQKYYDKTINWINDFIEYSANVDAYTSANEEFRAILERMCENFPEETSGDRANKEKLKKAIEEYTQYNGKEDIRLSLFWDYAKETVGNKIEDYLIKKFKSAVEDWIKNTFSATALSTLKTIGWAADVTWKICEYVTSNGALMDCRQMLRSNAYFEATMYNTLRDIESDFVNNSTIENARLFDAAFKFFKETQIYSMDTVISYFDTYQTAWLPAIQHMSNTFMNSAIEQVQISKMTLYKTYCHGVSYSLGGKVITIACPTDVYLYDESHTPVVVIEDSMVTLCAPEICAYTTNNVKIIVVPLDKNYSIEIFGTDDGKMDYSISEYDATLDNIQMTLYSDLILSSNSKYHGMVNNILGTQPSSYNLSNDSGEVEANYQLVTPESNVPSIAVAIAGNKTSMDVGDTIQLSATITPQNATVQSLIWTSSNSEVATISEEGKLVALSEGSTNITVQSIYGGISDTIAIIVTASTTSPEETYHLIVTNGIGSGDYETGTQVSITANAAPAGNSFDKWISNNGGTFADVSSASTTFTMPKGDVMVTAIYKDTATLPEQTYSLTVTNGTGSGNYEAGTQVSIVADAAPGGKEFDQWTTDNGGDFADELSSSTTFIMPVGNVTISATYKDISTDPGGKTVVNIINVSTSSDLIYTGSPQSGYTGTPTSTYTGDYDILYTGRSGTEYNSATPPTDAGDYSVTIKVPDSDATYTGNITLEFTIAKATQLAPAALQVSSKTSTSVSLKAVGANSNGAIAEYSKDGGTTWQSSPTFTGLSANTEYSFIARYSETKNFAASDVSAALKVQTSSDSSTTTPTTPSRPSYTPDNTYTPPTYNITTPSIMGGEISVNPASASSGSTVTITTTPDTGYVLASLTVSDANGRTIDLTDKGNGQYSFKMPNGRVSIDAEFKPVSIYVPWNNPFADVSIGDWYYDAVKFVNQNGLMNGVGNGLFAPNAQLSRAMLAEILYNKEGRPAVIGGSTFADVQPGAWYANAVAWASGRGIVTGYGNGLFGPDDGITREQVAVMLYRYAGSPVPPNLLLNFTDAYKVSDWAQDAVRWAVDQGILNGKGNGILDPAGKATRAEAAQMLKNYLEK